MKYYTDFKYFDKLVIKPIDTFIVVEEIAEDLLLIYSAVEGHTEIMKDYLEVCMEITKEHYKFVNANYFIPPEYLL